MRYLVRLADMRRAIICSIHQPRQSIWELFDKLELLSEGHLLYFGPPSGVVAWFSGTLGHQYLPLRDGLVCDWLLDLVSVGFAKRAAEKEHMFARFPNQHCNRVMSFDEICSAAKRFKVERLPRAISMSAHSRQDDSAGEGSRLLMVGIRNSSAIVLKVLEGSKAWVGKTL